MDTHDIGFEDIVSDAAGQQKKSIADWCARRLWSLWEMLEFHADRFFAAVDSLASLAQLCHQATQKSDKVILLIDAADVEHAKTILAQVRAMDLSGASIKAAERLVAAIDKREALTKDISWHVRQVHGRLLDDLAGRRFLGLSLHEAALYAPSAPHFGQAVADKFPSVGYEIEEAAKCQALGRSTASAFHSIRCLEVLIRAIARCLNIPDPVRGADRSWAKVLGTIREEIDRRWPPGARLAGDGHVFEELHASLAAIQNPWRNATMHLDQKYTEEEARYLFEMIRGLMRRAASRLDESGDPKA